jgi:hypothetical protein
LVNQITFEEGAEKWVTLLWDNGMKTLNIAQATYIPDDLIFDVNKNYTFDINEQADATAEFMSNFQQSLMQNNNSAIAASKLDELLNDFGGGNIISW